jgi:hypothetical protein
MKKQTNKKIIFVKHVKACVGQRLSTMELKRLVTQNHKCFGKF